MSSKVILVSGFEPFGGELINPSQMVVEKLPDSINGVAIKKVVLPVEFIRAPKLLINMCDEIKPNALIMIGQAGGRSSISLERQATNLMNTKELSDNSGYAPKSILIKDGGNDIKKATLPFLDILQELKDKNIKCELSSNAGRFVCNALLYNLLDYNEVEIPTGFIHIPYIKEQKKEPYMDFEEVYEGIVSIIKVVISSLK